MQFVTGFVFAQFQNCIGLSQIDLSNNKYGRLLLEFSAKSQDILNQQNDVIVYSIKKNILALRTAITHPIRSLTSKVTIVIGLYFNIEIKIVQYVLIVTPKSDNLSYMATVFIAEMMSLYKSRQSNITQLSHSREPTSLIWQFFFIVEMGSQ